MTSFKAQLLWDNISRQDLSAVHSMLESGHVNLEERDANGCTFLMVASEQGALSIVRELLQAGVDPNAVDNDNWNAILCACKEGHLEVVIELLERNVNLEHADMCGWTPLMWACYKGHTYVVSELLERGANPNVKGDHNMTCLAWAAGRGHTEIAKLLIDKGAKINFPDKYGTTPLIWACRKGHLEIVDALIGEGASVDASGMNSWTPLLVATRGGHFDVVRSVLSQDPNVNATDKDGLTSLAIAAREGYFDIVNDLLSKGAYVNLTDKNGDTILIHAVKGGHVDIVKSLLKKYVDVDVPGQDGKTALYCAVEKGYTEIVRLLLQSNPDLELSTKDEDTPLLRAVRMRNEECVRLLLEKGARVSASDKRGDTALHIAIRARSKRITELLLRNPRHSRLLYRMNKAGESPYSMDTYHQRGILPQIHGHGNLNATDAENLLGYEIYSSALADILSEPCLITPITMGLYAKWGSGKSFLLDKLRDEMNSFTQQNSQAELTWSWLIAFLLLLINSVIGETLGLAFGWQIGLAVGLGLIPIEYAFVGIIIFITARYDFAATNRISSGLGRRQKLLVLFLKMLFCVPRQRQLEEKQSAGTFSVRFLFSECTRLSSVGGEKSLAAMIGTLCDAVEREYGMLIARLFRVFKPHLDKSSSHFKSICCIPYFIIVLLLMACVQVGIGLAIGYGIEKSVVMDGVLIALASVVGLAIVANMYTWGQTLMALIFSQRKRVIRSADQMEELKMDGFMHHLKREVDMMSKLVTCMDSFTLDQTRLVVIVDGLDSCEQDKVLQVLDTVKSLFSDDGAPFITILAVDPHIIIKGIEQNLRSSFQDTNVNGFDYLRNVVHLPFYLQSQGMRIQQVEPPTSILEGGGEASPGKAQRQESAMTTGSSEGRPGRKMSRTMGSNHMVAGSLSGSLPGMIYASSFDLSSTLAKSDYFSDINPRSMRRLMNIVAVTARLLRAFNIDFKWHRLAAWVNLTEQWPYRLSWIIYYFEEADVIENSASLCSLYKCIAPRIPSTKEQDPLLEIDRNVRKLEASLTSKSGNFPLLNVADLKKFLPCTINLDPYLRKLIRETQHNLERHQAEIANLGGVFPHPPPPPPSSNNLIRDSTQERQGLLSSPGRYGTSLQQQSMMYGLYGPQSTLPFAAAMPSAHLVPSILQAQQALLVQQQRQAENIQQANRTARPGIKHPRDFFNNYTKPVSLSKCSVEDICSLLAQLKGLSPNHLAEYQASIRDNNVSGLVLTMCDLAELQPIISMRFGDWQLFRTAMTCLINTEIPQGSPDDLGTDSVDASSSLKTGPCSQSSSAMSYSHGSSTSSSQRNLPGRSVSMQESGNLRLTPEQHQLQQRKLRRNDSIVEQLSYETAILKTAVSEFVEESEEEEEEEDVIVEEVETLDMGEQRPRENSVESSGHQTKTETVEESEEVAVFKLGGDSEPTSPRSPPDGFGRTFSISGGSGGTMEAFSNDVSSSTSRMLPSQSSSENSSRTDINAQRSLQGPPSSSGAKGLRTPLSLSNLSPLITVLDAPKKSFGPAGSGEFTPLLGNIQLHPSPPGSSEFVPCTDPHPYPQSDQWSSLQTVSEPDLPSSTSPTQLPAPPTVFSTATSFTSSSVTPLQHSQIQKHHQSHATSSDPEGLGPSAPQKQLSSPSPAPMLTRSAAVERSDSESTTGSEQYASPHHVTRSLSTSIERLARPILGHFRQHFQQSGQDVERQVPHLTHMVSFDDESLIDPGSRSLSREPTEDFVQQSYSTIVEMNAAAAETEQQTGFHHELGEAFATMDQLPDSEKSSPDRETRL